MRIYNIDVSKLSDANMAKVIKIFCEEHESFGELTKFPHTFTMTVEVDNKDCDCRKIGNIVYLVGDKDENEDYPECWELFNMSEEMNSGDSYSTYISSIDILPKATEAEMLEVKHFLHNLT